MMKGNDMYTYNEDAFSDLFKGAFGFRPHNHKFYDASPAEKQEIWDYTCKSLERSIADQEAAKERALEEWHADLEVFTKFAGTRYSALRWMTQEEKFYDRQSVEQWVWQKGILFTDEGRALVKELDKIVKYESS